MTFVIRMTFVISIAMAKSSNFIIIGAGTTGISGGTIDLGAQWVSGKTKFMI